MTAHTLLRDLTLLVDKVEPDCRVDEALVTLLPGESFVFHLSQAPRDGEALRHPRVLRSANQLVAR